MTDFTHGELFSCYEHPAELTARFPEEAIEEWAQDNYDVPLRKLTVYAFARLSLPDETWNHAIGTVVSTIETELTKLTGGAVRLGRETIHGVSVMLRAFPLVADGWPYTVCGTKTHTLEEVKNIIEDEE